MAPNPDTVRLDWLERVAKHAVLISGSESEGFYITVATVGTRDHADLRAAIDALMEQK